MRSRGAVAALTLLLCLLLPGTSASQMGGVGAFPRLPTRVDADSARRILAAIRAPGALQSEVLGALESSSRNASATVLQESLVQRGVDLPPATIVALASLVTTEPWLGRRWLLRWDPELPFWRDRRGIVLPMATLGVSGKAATAFTEIASASSGGWRFGVGTTLTVANEEEEEEEPEDPEAPTGAELDAFSRFLAGGGSLSMSAARPLAFVARSYDRAFLYLVPRGWANIPTLSSADGVEEFGGEAAVELQYHRVQAATDGVPFLQIHLRAGAVAGSNDYYQTLGDRRTAFVYLVPSFSFVAEEKVKIGLSGWIGPRSIAPRDRLQIHFSFLNAKSTED